LREYAGITLYDENMEYVVNMDVAYPDDYLTINKKYSDLFGDYIKSGKTYYLDVGSYGSSWIGMVYTIKAAGIVEPKLEKFLEETRRGNQI